MMDYIPIRQEKRQEAVFSLEQGQRASTIKVPGNARMYHMSEFLASEMLLTASSAVNYYLWQVTPLLAPRKVIPAAVVSLGKEEMK